MAERLEDALNTLDAVRAILVEYASDTPQIYGAVKLIEMVCADLSDGIGEPARDGPAKAELFGNTLKELEALISITGDDVR